MSAALRSLGRRGRAAGRHARLGGQEGPLGPADRIDLNRASAAELMRLPGIGEKRALAIVAARTQAALPQARGRAGGEGHRAGLAGRVRANVQVASAAPSGAAPDAAAHR